MKLVHTHTHTHVHIMLEVQLLLVERTFVRTMNNGFKNKNIVDIKFLGGISLKR